VVASGANSLHFLESPGAEHQGLSSAQSCSLSSDGVLGRFSSLAIFPRSRSRLRTSADFRTASGDALRRESPRRRSCEFLLCWSEARSHCVASAFREFLLHLNQELIVPQDLQLAPFLSENIEKELFWFQAVEHELEFREAAILAVTPENTDSPWMHYEAGAIANRRSGRPRLFREGCRTSSRMPTSSPEPARCSRAI